MADDADQRVPTELPLLQKLVARFADAQPLRGWTALLIQHQLGSQVVMAKALLDLGIAPGRMYWLDIPYTANGAVYESLRWLGIPQQNFAPSFYNLELKYAAYQHERVQQIAMMLAQTLRSDDHLLVLDDGAYFLEALTCIAQAPPDVRIVEQTTRGTIKIGTDATLREKCDELLVVNVAESAPKKDIEGPLIGDVVCQALVRRLGPDLRSHASSLCLVLGFGSIGQSVASSLVREVGVAPERIYILDPSPAAQAAAAAAGYRPWSRAGERVRFRTVIGCSGTTSFTVGDRAFLEDGAVLVSASSGSAELSREGFIELADIHPGADVYVVDRESLPTRSVHDDIVVHLVDRDARFLNGGFPANFDGRVNCVPPLLIQATHALQVGAAIQAVGSNQRGLVPVDEQLCDWVSREFARSLSPRTPRGK